MKRVVRTIGKPLPENTVYVGAGSKYENPFEKTKDMEWDEVAMRYKFYLSQGIKDGTINLKPLQGKNLAVYTPLNRWSHADELLRCLAMSKL